MSLKMMFRGRGYQCLQLLCAMLATGFGYLINLVSNYCVAENTYT